MAYADLIETINITSLADLDAELLDRVPSEADSGWDALRDSWLIRDDSADLDPHVALGNVAFSGLARGVQVGSKTMWIQSRQAKCVARGLFKVEVVSLGLLSARGLKVRYSSGANIQSGENISVPGFGIAARASGRESQVTCDVEYVVTAGLQPGNASFYTAAVGTAVDPPMAYKPTVKASLWSSLTDFTYWYPNGWVLDSSEIENLPGLDTVWLVRDRYQYQYAYSA